MKALFLSFWYPYPPDNGSKIRILNLIKQLSACCEIDLFSFAPESVEPERLAAMRRYCRRIEVVPCRPFHPRGLKALFGFASMKPRSVVDTFSVDMQGLVEQAGRERAYDVVIASQLDMAPYGQALARTPKVLEEIELTTLHEEFMTQHHPVKKLRHGLTWWKQARYVGDLLRTFDGCTVVSEKEKERVLQVSPGYHPIGVIPNGVDISNYAADFGSPEADSLAYAGALTYDANFDAVDFFLREIFPLIRAERPNAKLTVTGRLDGVPVQRLASIGDGGVTFSGYVDDIRPTVARHWASVVPLRMGGGTRLKILESLALGTPVVATSKGVEGLDLAPGRDLLVADGPSAFAAAVLRLLQDAELRETLSRNGRQSVAAKYDWQIIGRLFNDFVEAVHNAC